MPETSITTVPPAGAPAPPPAPAGTQVVYYVYQMGGPASASVPGADIPWAKLNPMLYIRPLQAIANLALWILFLIGACVLMSNCNNGNFDNLGFGPITSTFGTLNGVADCSHYYGLLWWSVWLQFLCVVLQILLVWQTIWPGVTAIHTLAIYFFIMSSVLMFGIADSYNNAIYISNKKQMGSFSITNGSSLVCAGAIGNLILNFIYIIVNSWISTPSPVLAPPDLAAAPAADAEATVTAELAKA